MVRPLFSVINLVYTVAIFLAIFTFINYTSATSAAKKFSCLRCHRICNGRKAITDPATIAFCNRCNSICNGFGQTDPWMKISMNKKRKYNLTELDPNFEVDPETGTVGNGNSPAMQGRTFGAEVGASAQASASFSASAFSWWGRRRR